MQENSQQARKAFIDLLKINVSLLEGFTFANDQQRMAIADNWIQQLRDFAVRSSVSKSDSIRFEQTYAVLRRLSLDCPDSRIRSKLSYELSRVEGYSFPPIDHRVSRFLSRTDLGIDESLESNNTLWHTIFDTHRGRIPTHFFAFGFDPGLLDSFFSTMRELIFGSESPLPIPTRIYLGITAAARVNCEPLVRELMEQFLLQGGDESWLLDPDRHVPLKLQMFQRINVKTAHFPWEMNAEEIANMRVNFKWASGELSHALLVTSTYHAIGSLIHGLGLRVSPDLGSDWVVDGGDVAESAAPQWMVSFGLPDVTQLLSQYSPNADWNEVTPGDWERMFLLNNAGRPSASNNIEMRQLLRDRMESRPASTTKDLMLIGFRLPQERFALETFGLLADMNIGTSNGQVTGGSLVLEGGEKLCCCLEYLLSRNLEQNSFTGQAAFNLSQLFNSNNNININSSFSSCINNNNINNATTTTIQQNQNQQASSQTPNKFDSNNNINSTITIPHQHSGDLQQRTVTSSPLPPEVLTGSVVAHSASHRTFSSLPNTTTSIADVSSFPSGLRCGLCNRPFGSISYTQEGFDNTANTLRIEAYTWEESVATALCGVAPNTASKLQNEISLSDEISDGTIRGIQVPTTRPLRQGIVAYVQKLLGVHQEDFNYFVMNSFVALGQKVYLKKFACYPERITMSDACRVMDTLGGRDLVHYNVLVFEGRRQAELLFGLKALMNGQFI